MRPNENVSEANLQEAQRIRNRFESELRSKVEVSIELVVSSAPEQLKSLLVGELIAAELEWHRESGTTPPLDSYFERFPDESEIITAVYRQSIGSFDELPSFDSLEVTYDETRVVSNPTHDDDEISRTYSPRDTKADSVPKSGPESSPKSKSSSLFVSGNKNDIKYVVEHEIDRGGMGAILQVQDLQLNRTLAMKVMLGQEDLMAGSVDDRAAEKLERFFREASITSRLDHPGVVPVHELGKDEDGRSYFTMKLVQGKTLKHVFKELKNKGGLWNRARVIEVLIRVCDTIAFAHSKGVIHRDLKPANIMVGEFGETYVMDWGLAKVLREQEKRSTSTATSFKPELAVDSSHTMHGSVMGTPHYMPPEQAAGRIDDLDERSDIYSLGALLYQMLSGHKPYDEHKSAMKVVHAVREEAPTAILDHTKKAHPELVAIAKKAMQREREDRYSSGTEMADDLRAFLDNRVVAAYRTGWAAKVEKWVVRNRSIIATAMLLLVTGLGAIAYQQYQNSIEVSQKNKSLSEKSMELAASLQEVKEANRKEHEANEKEREANRKEKEANDRLWGRKLVFDSISVIGNTGDATLASLLALEALEHYKYDGDDTRSAIYAGASKLSENLILDGHRESVSRAIFSPDGKYVVTISYDGTGIVWDAATGKRISLFTNKRGAAFRSVVFSKDGSQILASGNDGTIGIWETQTGHRKLLIELGDDLENTGARPSVSMVQFLPDDSTLIAASAAGLFLLDRRTGEQIGILKTNEESAKNLYENVRVSHDGARVIASSKNGRFFLWDTKSRKLMKSGDVDESVITQSLTPRRSVDFNLDGSLFVTASSSFDAESKSSARTWNANTGELDSEVSLGIGISTAVFHPNRNLLMVGVNDTNNPTVQIWDLEAKKVVATSEKLPAVAETIRFSPAGNAFVAICGDGNLSVWQLESSQSNETIIRHVENLVGHSQQVSISDAGFDASGTRVVSASTDWTARIWNVNAERAVPLLGSTWFPESTFTDMSIKVNSKGDRILTLAADKQSVNLWSYPELKFVQNISIVDPNLYWQFTADGELVLGSSKSGDVVCWNAIDGSKVREFKNVGRLFTASYDPTKQRIVLNTNKQTSVWNLAEDGEKPEREFQKSENETHILNQDGSVALSYLRSDSALKRLDLETGEIKTLPIDTCHAASFSPDGRYFWCKGRNVATDGSMNSTSIMILDGQNASLKHTIEDVETADIVRWIKSAEFSLDSSKIRVQHYKMGGEQAVGPAFSIWSTVDGSKICEFGDYGTDVVWKGATDDFSRLLINTNDGAQLIDGNSGLAIATLPLSIGKFKKAVFSRDGRFFVSQEVSENKNPVTGRPESQIALWDAKSGDLLATLPRDSNLYVGDFLPDSNYFITVSETNQIQVWPTDIIDETKKHLARSLTPTEQDFYLSEKKVRSSSEQRKSELIELESQVRLLGTITADRRQEAWRVLDELTKWLGKKPSKQDVDSAINCSIAMLSGPYDSEPKILGAIADFYKQRGDQEAVVRLLEQASRHPRGSVVEKNQLESARKALAPAIASFNSANSLAEQLQNDNQAVASFDAAINWAGENNAPLYQYLTAQKHYFKKEYAEASELLKQIVDTLPTEPEPYLLYAKCLLEQSKPDAAADVLRTALDIEECRSPEIWRTWMQISFAELGRSPAQLLAELPAPSVKATTESSFGEHVRWLLQCLVDGKPLRINSGWFSDVSIGEEAWSKDCFFTYGFGFFEFSGEARAFAMPIENTDKDILYQSERYFPDRVDSPAGYQIPLPNGKYKVTLGFSEIYQEERSFDVIAENKVMLRNYDPANGEFATADESTVESTVGDGMLNIEFESKNDFPPKISTLSIVPASK